MNRFNLPIIGLQLKILSIRPNIPKSNQIKYKCKSNSYTTELEMLMDQLHKKILGIYASAVS